MDAGTSRLTPQEWRLAEELLREVPFGYFAMAVNGGPFVVPMNFAYEAQPQARGPGGRLYIHTGEGRKSRVLAESPRVCVAVSAGEAFVRGTNACRDGFAFRSVIVEGQATRLLDEAERQRALRAIVAKYDPAAADQTFPDEAFAQTLVYAITIESVGYKQRPRPGEDQEPTIP